MMLKECGAHAALLAGALAFGRGRGRGCARRIHHTIHHSIHPGIHHSIHSGIHYALVGRIHTTPLQHPPQYSPPYSFQYSLRYPRGRSLLPWRVSVLNWFGKTNPHNKSTKLVCNRALTDERPSGIARSVAGGYQSPAVENRGRAGLGPPSHAAGRQTQRASKEIPGEPIGSPPPGGGGKARSPRHRFFRFLSTTHAVCLPPHAGFHVSVTARGRVNSLVDFRVRAFSFFDSVVANAGFGGEQRQSRFEGVMAW